MGSYTHRLLVRAALAVLITGPCVLSVAVAEAMSLPDLYAPRDAPADSLVLDRADVLSSEVEQQLTQQCREFLATRAVRVVVLTVAQDDLAAPDAWNQAESLLEGATAYRHTGLAVITGFYVPVMVVYFAVNDHRLACSEGWTANLWYADTSTAVFPSPYGTPEQIVATRLAAALSHVDARLSASTWRRRLVSSGGLPWLAGIVWLWYVLWLVGLTLRLLDGRRKPLWAVPAECLFGLAAFAGCQYLVVYVGGWPELYEGMLLAVVLVAAHLSAAVLVAVALSIPVRPLFWLAVGLGGLHAVARVMAPDAPEATASVTVYVMERLLGMLVSGGPTFSWLWAAVLVLLVRGTVRWWDPGILAQVADIRGFFSIADRSLCYHAGKPLRAPDAETQRRPRLTRLAAESSFANGYYNVAMLSSMLLAPVVGRRLIAAEGRRLPFVTYACKMASVRLHLVPRAQAQAERGDYVAANHCVSVALAVLSELARHNPGVMRTEAGCDCHSLLGEISFALGRPEEGVRALIAARDLARGSGYDTQVLTALRLGRAFNQMGDYRKAKDWFREALSVLKQVEAKFTLEGEPLGVRDLSAALRQDELKRTDPDAYGTLHDAASLHSILQDVVMLQAEAAYGVYLCATQLEAQLRAAEHDDAQARADAAAAASEAEAHHREVLIDIAPRTESGSDLSRMLRSDGLPATGAVDELPDHHIDIVALPPRADQLSQALKMDPLSDQLWRLWDAAGLPIASLRLGASTHEDQFMDALCEAARRHVSEEDVAQCAELMIQEHREQGYDLTPDHAERLSRELIDNEIREAMAEFAADRRKSILRESVAAGRTGGIRAAYRRAAELLGTKARLWAIVAAAKVDKRLRPTSALVLAWLARNEAARIAASEPTLARRLLLFALDCVPDAGRRDETAWVLLELARLGILQQERLAPIRLAQWGLAIAKDVGHRDLQREAHTTLGRALRAAGDLDSARLHLAEAIDLLEEARATIVNPDRRDLFFSQRVDVYAEQILVLLELGLKAEALEHAERSRSRVLVELLGSSRLRTRSEADASLVLEDEQLQMDLLSLQVRLEALLGELGELDQRGSLGALPLRERRRLHALQAERGGMFQQQARLQERLAEVKQQMVESASEAMSIRDVAPVSFDAPTQGADLRRELLGFFADCNERVVLLEYYSTEEGTVVFVVPCWPDPEESLLVRRADASVSSVQAELLSDFREEVLRRERRAEVLADLYQLLIAPVRDDLRRLGATMVGFVPHGPLHSLPLHALRGADEEGLPRYFIEDYPCFVLPSLSVVPFLARKRTSNPGAALVMGNPDPPGDLEFAESEARAVARLLSVQPLLRSEATEHAIRLHSASAGILHLACHGEFNPRDPALSYLRLADGLLQVDEVMSDLNLSASLVVLSACSSAVSSVSGGDELAGMVRAWLYAGTPSVLASLWNVDDEATCEIMEAFYQHWLGEGLSRARALQRAQLDWLDNRRREYAGGASDRPEWHPALWAAFAVMGDPT